MKLELKKKLIADVEAKFGKDSGRVIEYLYEAGTLDDCLARQHMAKVETFNRLLSTDISEVRIHEGVGIDYGLTRERVGQLGRNTSNYRP